MSKPKCKCGAPCAYYGKTGGFSVGCEQCNAKHAKWQRDRRALLGPDPVRLDAKKKKVVQAILRSLGK